MIRFYYWKILESLQYTKVVFDRLQTNEFLSFIRGNRIFHHSPYNNRFLMNQKNTFKRNLLKRIYNAVIYFLKILSILVRNPSWLWFNERCHSNPILFIGQKLVLNSSRPIDDNLTSDMCPTAPISIHYHRNSLR